MDLMENQTTQDDLLHAAHEWRHGLWREVWPHDARLDTPRPQGGSAPWRDLPRILDQARAWARWVASQSDASFPPSWDQVTTWLNRAALAPTAIRAAAEWASGHVPPDRRPRPEPPPQRLPSAQPAARAEMDADHNAHLAAWRTAATIGDHAHVEKHLRAWLEGSAIDLWSRWLALDDATECELYDALRDRPALRRQMCAVEAILKPSWHGLWSASRMPQSARAIRFTRWVEACLDPDAESDTSHALLLAAWLRRWPPIAAATLVPWWRARRTLPEDQHMPALSGFGKPMGATEGQEDLLSEGQDMTVAQALQALEAKAAALRHAIAGKHPPRAARGSPRRA